jgi:hypothetical protein
MVPLIVCRGDIRSQEEKMNVVDQIPGFAPKREVAVEGVNYRITVTPPDWVGAKGQSILLTPDQYSRYEKWLHSNYLIQDVLPDLTDEEREILINGDPDPEEEGV